MNPGATPVVIPGQRLFLKKFKAEKVMVEKFLAVCILKPCVSTSSAWNVFISTKDFGLGCTGDLRGVNAQTIQYRYPEENADEHIEFFVTKSLFSCLNWSMGTTILCFTIKVVSRLQWEILFDCFSTRAWLKVWWTPGTPSSVWLAGF